MRKAASGKVVEARSCQIVGLSSASAYNPPAFLRPFAVRLNSSLTRYPTQLYMMINWQQIAQNPRQIVDPVIHFIRARRREEATLTFAILLLWIGYSFSNWLTPELKDLLKPWPVVLIIQCILYVAGFALLAYAGFKIWRLVHVPDLPLVKDRPMAIKGPMAFTEGDGALFRKLGRETDLQRLLGLILDNQVMMVV